MDIKEDFQTKPMGMVGRAGLADSMELEALVGMAEVDMEDLVGTRGKVVGMTTETQSGLAFKDTRECNVHSCSLLMHPLTRQIIAFHILCVRYFL